MAPTVVEPAIRIDAPGDGEWIMQRVAGVFTPDCDHAIAKQRDGRVVGGFAFCQYLGASMTMHMAGDDEHWCSRTMLWMAFHYAFIQLGCRKLIGPVRANNYPALAIDLRGGWRIEALIRDAYPDAHMLVLTMDRATCPWLRLRPQGWAPGDFVRALERQKEFA